MSLSKWWGELKKGEPVASSLVLGFPAAARGQRTARGLSSLWGPREDPPGVPWEKGFRWIVKSLMLGLALERGEERSGDFGPSGELRVDEELEGGAGDFGLSTFRGFSKAFANLGRGSFASAIS